MIVPRLRGMMAREYEHVRRFLSRKDPNYVLRAQVIAS